MTAFGRKEEKMQETNVEQLKKEILELKEKQDAVILAHYYVDGEVQAIADYVGDSYFLSKLAIELKEQTIIFCGVSFMGESAKVLNPGKKVVMADEFADCPMAHMTERQRSSRSAVSGMMWQLYVMSIQPRS